MSDDKDAGNSSHDGNPRLSSAQLGVRILTWWDLYTDGTTFYPAFYDTVYPSASSTAWLAQSHPSHSYLL